MSGRLGDLDLERHGLAETDRGSPPQFRRRSHLSRTKKRPHFEPVQVAELLAAAAASPPDDTIIRVAVHSGLRRGEIFGLQWFDIDAGDGGRIHVRRSIYQGAITTPKTEDSDRVVDMPRPSERYRPVRSSNRAARHNMQ